MTIVKRLRTCDAAAQVLRETGNPAVMWGDLGLLDLIAIRAGTKRDGGKYKFDGHPLARHERILNALSRQPGELVPRYTLIGVRRVVRCFWLPECVPERLRVS